MSNEGMQLTAQKSAPRLMPSVRRLVAQSNMRISKKPLIIALLFMSQSIWASALDICV
jgi:hypothetical protein